MKTWRNHCNTTRKLTGLCLALALGSAGSVSAAQMSSAEEIIFTTNENLVAMIQEAMSASQKETPASLEDYNPENLVLDVIAQSSEEDTEETKETKETKETEETKETQDASLEFTSKESTTYEGPVLTPFNGTVMGPSGKETYYNLDMSGVIEIMRGMGNTDEYWVREDGVKMLGDYIMCAANLDVHPRGSLVESSLGMCIVCDTGGFAYENPYQLDIAVTW